MKKVLFFFDAPTNAILAWISLIITYCVLDQADLQNDLFLKILLQLAAFDCFEIHMMRRIMQKVSTSYRNEYGEELDDYTLNEAVDRHRKSLKYLLIVGTAIIATFIAVLITLFLIEALKFLIIS